MNKFILIVRTKENNDNNYHYIWEGIQISDSSVSTEFRSGTDPEPFSTAEQQFIDWVIQQKNSHDKTLYYNRGFNERLKSGDFNQTQSPVEAIEKGDLDISKIDDLTKEYIQSIVLPTAKLIEDSEVSGIFLQDEKGFYLLNENGKLGKPSVEIVCNFITAERPKDLLLSQIKWLGIRFGDPSDIPDEYSKFLSIEHPDSREFVVDKGNFSVVRINQTCSEDTIEISGTIKTNPSHRASQVTEIRSKISQVLGGAIIEDGQGIRPRNFKAEIEDPVELTANFKLERHQDSDLDNLLKVVLDAIRVPQSINECKGRVDSESQKVKSLLSDDKIVKKITATKDNGNPDNVLITIQK